MKYFQLKNIADKMIEQFEHESSVQKDVIQKLVEEAPKASKSAKKVAQTEDTRKQEQQILDGISTERNRQVEDARKAALIETKMRLGLGYLT